jgi:hypothetical protein
MAQIDPKKQLERLLQPIKVLYVRLFRTLPGLFLLSLLVAIMPRSWFGFGELNLYWPLMSLLLFVLNVLGALLAYGLYQFSMRRTRRSKTLVRKVSAYQQGQLFRASVLHGVAVFDLLMVGVLHIWPGLLLLALR